MSRFFIDRPIFAWVLSIVIVVAGLTCLPPLKMPMALPVAQYPPIVPPTIQVSANYPGASAQTLSDTVAQPIEAQVNGVEGMIYMSSTCTNNGSYNLTVSFNVGTDIHAALMLVQIRVQLAMPQLPRNVQEQGVNVQMKSPNILLAINMISPDGSQDPLYLSNYAQINLFDELSRSPGVGLVSFLGQRQYSMRAWLDPQKLAALNLTTSEVITAIQWQNVEVTPGNIGQQPVPKGQNYQLVMNTLGRLTTPKQFGAIIVKAGKDGRLVYLRDVVRNTKFDKNNKPIPGTEGIELGAQNFDLDCALYKKVDGQPKRYPSVALAVFALPTANALETADKLKATMERLKQSFPKGVDYEIAYDTTPFIEHSVKDVFKTIVEAAILVIIVVMCFLQDWRAMLLPMIDIVVAVIGTLIVMSLMGFSLNNLSLFGLVLAVGIVVDDSIVVVENIERWMGKGLHAREATIKAMEEITGPVIGITLVLAAVFLPVAIIPGLSGQFFKQFALTIATAAFFSATNALTMAPARAVAWIKPHGEGHEAKEAMPRIGNAGLIAILTWWLLGLVLGPLLGKEWHWAIHAALLLPGAIAGWIFHPQINAGLGWFFGKFNKGFDWIAGGYARTVGVSLRLCLIVLVVYVGLLALTGVGFATSPTGFIPEQDQGYLLVNIDLPDASSVQRTDQQIRALEQIALETPGVRSVMSVGGYSAFFQCNAPSWGTMFVILDDFEHRKGEKLQAAYIIKELNEKFYAKVMGCKAAVFGAPPVPGLGQSGGFQLQVEDRQGLGLQALQEVTETIVEKANQQPGLTRVFSTFRANTPQLYLEIDREMVEQMGVSMNDVNNTLNANFGSLYVNQFNTDGRIWQVNIQAAGEFRTNAEYLMLLQVRNRQGDMVPLGSVMTIEPYSGPVFIMRYNNNNSAAINGSTKEGWSSGQALSVMQKLFEENKATGMVAEWTNISYQEDEAAKAKVANVVPMVIAIFGLAVIAVFLVLSALYESWSLPFAIVMVVPMCLLCSIAGLVWISHMPIDIFSQIGFVVLIALAVKNAILIVEYAKEKHMEGMELRAATVEACKLRLRPILMTSLAFIFGVYPLVVATGAGWEMRRSLGMAVISGMIGVTFFGIFLTPVFYYVIAGLSKEKPAEHPPEAHRAD